MSLETSVKTEIEVSKESLHDWRLALATLREKKGMETVVIHLGNALVDSASRLGLHGDVVDLLWEGFLSGQHMVMNEYAKKEIDRDKRLIEKGLEVMDETAVRAHGYIEEHNLDNIKARSYRFLGRLADYKGDFTTAIDHYSHAVSSFKKESNPLVRVNRLEIQGFLAFSMMKSDRVEDGLELAKSTFRDFNESEDGLELKKADYFTWAVWASGIPIRTVETLIDKGVLTDKEWAQQWISQIESILIIPEGDETWGDKTFEYRKDEVKRVRSKLERF